MRLRTIVPILVFCATFILTPQIVSAHYRPPICQPPVVNYTPSVSFYVNNVAVTTTNQLTVKVRYSLNIKPNEILGIRFSDNNKDWYTVNQLEKVPANELKKRGIPGQWNFWPENKKYFELNKTFPKPGTYTVYIQVGNIKGKIVSAQATIVITGVSVPPQPPVDTTKPVISSVLLSEISGDMSNPEKTSKAQNYLMFKASDNSGSASYSYSLDGVNYSTWANISNTTLNTVPVDFGTVSQNQVLTAYLKVKDAAGNTATSQDSITYYVEPPKDVTAPIITTVLLSPVQGDLSNPVNTDKANNYLMFEATDSESGIGMYSYSLDGSNFSQWAQMNNGLNSILVDFGLVNQNQVLTAFVKVKDNAGNEVQSTEARVIPAQDSIIYYVEPPKDTTAPVVTNFTISPVRGDLSNPELTSTNANYLMFEATDSGSGLDSFSYALDNGAYSTWSPMTSGLNIMAVAFSNVYEGNIMTGHLKIKDKAGNEVYVQDTIKYKGIITARVTINSGAAYTNSTALLLSTVISSGAGAPYTHYRYAESEAAILNMPWLVPFAATNFTLTGNTNGTRSVCIQAKNSVDTVSEIYCDTIILDTTGPNMAVATAGTIYNTQVTLYFNGTDTVLPGNIPGVGNMSYRFSIDGAAWTGWEAYATTKTVYVGDYPGTHGVQVQFRDGLGNLSSPLTVYIIRN